MSGQQKKPKVGDWIRFRSDGKLVIDRVEMTGRARPFRLTPIYTIWKLHRYLSAPDVPKAEVLPGLWWPARPVNGAGFFARLEAAWRVLRGEADAVVWRPEPHHEAEWRKRQAEEQG